LLNAAEALKPGGAAGVAIARDPGHVRISVWDTGRGIPPDEMDRIFEPFFSTSSEGTGLGLPIALRIARAHGGELQLESTPGKGTTAWVTFSAFDPSADQLGQKGARSNPVEVSA
jgi:two-component system sensor histidine kinase FlrB